MIDYTPHLIDSLERSVSPERLARYSLSTNGDLEKALRLYAWNAEVSESLYSPLHHLEITLRNSFNDKLKSAYGPNWYDNQSIAWTQPLSNAVREAKAKVIRKKPNFVPSDIVAALMLGFWTGLLEKRYDRTLWRFHLYHCFTVKPANFTRKMAHTELESIRRLRNRIAHHEPLISLRLDDEYRRLCDVLAWLCPDTADWMKRLNHFDSVWSSKPL